MVINHNIAALNTYGRLGANSGMQSKALEKLSSGLRINRAGDDAAGLAISEKMRAQIRGLDQASRNAQDGISLIQTAEGALTETHSILQRMRELTAQSANDTNVGIDRSEIQKEINQLSSEINRIGNTTEFNTQKLLKGDGSAVTGGDPVQLDKVGLGTAQNLTGGSITEAKAANLQVAMSVGAFANVTTDLNNREFVFKFNGEAITLKIAQTDAGTADVNKIEVTNGNTEVTLTLDKNATEEEFVIGKIGEALKAVIQANDNIDEDNFVIGRDKNVLSIQTVATGAGQSVAVSLKTGTNDSLLVSTNDGASFAAVGAIATDTGTAEVRVQAAVSASFFTAADLKSQVLSTGIDINNTDYFNAAGSLTVDGAKKWLVGKGFTVGDETVEFFNSNDGDYAGSADHVVDLAQISFATASSYEGGPSASTKNSDMLTRGIVDQLGSKMDDVIFTTTSQAGTDRLIITAKEAGSEFNDIRITDGADVKGKEVVGSTFKASFQVGANQGQSISINIEDVRSEAIGIVGKAGSDHTTVEGAVYTSVNNVTNGSDDKEYIAALDVSTHEKASAAITVINNAIEKVSSQRSSLGAVQNRLEHTINNLSAASENLTAAESRIRDVDMAKEMMNFTKTNILSQAAQAMLAQANQQPQGVLQLLR